MRIFGALFLCVCLMGSLPASAQPVEEPPSLDRVIEEYERNESELARLKEQQGSVPTTQEAARLRARVGELEVRQEELAQALEEIVGPAPAAVSHEKPVALEEQMDALETRHDTTLEKDVEERLR